MDEIVNSLGWKGAKRITCWTDSAPPVEASKDTQISPCFSQISILALQKPRIEDGIIGIDSVADERELGQPLSSFIRMYSQDKLISVNLQCVDRPKSYAFN